MDMPDTHSERPSRLQRDVGPHKSRQTAMTRQQYYLNCKTETFSSQHLTSRGQGSLQQRERLPSRGNSEGSPRLYDQRQSRQQTSHSMCYSTPILIDTTSSRADRERATTKVERTKATYSSTLFRRQVYSLFSYPALSPRSTNLETQPLQSTSSQDQRISQSTLSTTVSIILTTLLTTALSCLATKVVSYRSLGGIGSAYIKRPTRTRLGRRSAASSATADL